ncbi:MAG TPA: HEAT repeat domain-containing protein [Humisphaera sp.]
MLKHTCLRAAVAVMLLPTCATAAPAADTRPAAGPTAPLIPPATRASVADLAAQLREKQKDRTARNAVARQLGEYGPQAAPALPALLETMWDDCCFSETLGPVLRAIGPEAITFLAGRVLAGENDAGQAIDALGKMGPDGAGGIPALVESLRDDRTKVYVRERIARALLDIGPKSAPAAIPTLVARLAKPGVGGDGGSGAREEGWVMGEALGRFGATDAVPELKRLLAHADPHVRGPAALALVTMAREIDAAEPVLLAVRGGPDTRARYVATHQMANVADRMFPYASVFAEAMEDPYQPVRSSASYALAEMGAPAVPTLLAAQKAAGEQTRHGAVYALGRIAMKHPELAPRVLGGVRRGLYDPARGVRSQAAYLLGPIGAPAAVALADLRRVADTDKDDHVRRTAADAITAIEKAVADGPAGDR